MDGTTRKTGLLDLPPELICAVTELFMENSFGTRAHRDLWALRLTCRQLRDAASKPFAIRFFQKRSHVISAFSINALHDIISDPYFGPHVKELTLVVMRARYTGYEHAFGLRNGGREKDIHASDKEFVVSGLYGQLMEKVFAVAHSYGNNLNIKVKRLAGTAHGWFDVRGSEDSHPESYALARTLNAARRAGIPPPDFRVETGLDSDHMKNTIMNHLSSQDDQCFSFSLHSSVAMIVYDHRQKKLKLSNHGVYVPSCFGTFITQLVNAFPTQMAITRLEVRGYWLTHDDELAINVLQPLLTQLESVELCSMYKLRMQALSSIMNFLAEAPNLTRFVFSLDPKSSDLRPDVASEGFVEYEGNDLSSKLKNGVASLALRTTE